MKLAATTPIALLDWDNSMRAGWALIDWAERLAADALIPSQTFRDLRAADQRRRDGLLSYAAFARFAAQTFAGGIERLEVATAESHARRFVEEETVGLYPFALTLLSALSTRAIGAVVVSGAPSEILEASRERYGLAATYGTVFGQRDGIYSGNVDLNRSFRAEKQAIVAELLPDDRRVPLAVGDSESDLPLLERADLPVVVDDLPLSRLLPGSVVVDPTRSDISSVLEQLSSAL
jgi:phosphoserine phosphatase